MPQGVNGTEAYCLIISSSCSSNSSWEGTCTGLLLDLVSRDGVFGTVSLGGGDLDRILRPGSVDKENSSNL